MKFIGYNYMEKPSPCRVPVFVLDEGDGEITLEDLKYEKMKYEERR